jgi:hypothetical protein
VSVAAPTWSASCCKPERGGGPCPTRKPRSERARRGARV